MFYHSCTSYKKGIGMCMKIVSYDLIPDSVKEQFCPRQVFIAYPLLTDKVFMGKYCSKIPCLGDIACNRAACWEMLESSGPYIQDDLIKISQKPKCPSEFFAHLADFIDFSGVSVQSQYKIWKDGFASLNDKGQVCGIPAIPCRIYDCPDRVENICWARYFKELKSRQK